MTITEKTAYLKGLLEGMNIDETKPEGKLLAAVIDTLDAMALEVADLTEEAERLEDYCDELDSDLGDLESDYYECWDDDDDEYYDDDDEYDFCADCDKEDCSECEYDYAEDEEEEDKE